MNTRVPISLMLRDKIIVTTKHQEIFEIIAHVKPIYKVHTNPRVQKVFGSMLIDNQYIITLRFHEKIYDVFKIEIASNKKLLKVQSIITVNERKSIVEILALEVDNEFFLEN